MRRRIKQLISAVATGMLFAGPAIVSRADIIVTLPSTTSTPVTGGQTFTYTASLTNDERLQPGNFFTLYDIPGLISATGPSGWTETTQTTGITPSGIVPTDSPSIPNVTFTYTGSTEGPGPLDLGAFLITTDAQHGGLNLGQFGAEAIKSGGATDGLPVDNIGFIGIPAAGVGNLAPLPPAALAILPAVLLAAYQGRRWSRSRAKAV